MTQTIKMLFRVGDRFEMDNARPWHAGSVRGVERSTVLCEVSEVKPDGFDYQVLGLLKLEDAPPFGMQPWSKGGITTRYAIELMAAGTLRPTQRNEEIERRRWVLEHGLRYDVPAVLSTDPEVVDLSWHNDISPSFTTEALAARPDDDYADIRLWVDHPDPNQREYPELPRFRVYDHWLNVEVFESETDIDGALAMLKRMSAERLAAMDACDTCKNGKEFPPDELRRVEIDGHSATVYCARCGRCLQA